MATKPKLQESYENPELAARLQKMGVNARVGERSGVSREESVRRARAYAERRRGSATERNNRSQQRSRNEGTQQQRSSRGTQRVDSSRGGQRPVSNYSPTPQTQGMGRPQIMQAQRPVTSGYSQPQPYSQRPIPRPAMGYGNASYMNNPAPQQMGPPPQPAYNPLPQNMPQYQAPQYSLQEIQQLLQMMQGPPIPQSFGGGQPPQYAPPMPNQWSRRW